MTKLCIREQSRCHNQLVSDSVCCQGRSCPSLLSNRCLMSCYFIVHSARARSMDCLTSYGSATSLTAGLDAAVLQSRFLGCRIHRLHFCIGVRPPSNESPGYDTKQSDGEAPVLEFWKMWSIPSLLLLPDPLWLRVVVPDRVIGQGSNRTVWPCKPCANKWFMFDHLTV